MKTIYIVLIGLLAQIATIAQVPCDTSLDSINVKIDLDPEVDFIPSTDGQVPHSFDFPEAEESGEYKKVITWVHGMNGNSASWVHASDYANTTYNALPLRVEYTDFQASMETVKIGVEASFRTEWEANKDLTSDEGKRNSFAIAHSLGGIAIRGTSEKYPYLLGKVNGVVTVSSPHGGSKLANYVDTPAGPGSLDLVQDLKDFASESCKAFGLGPARELGEDAHTLLGILSDLGFLDIDNVLSGVCGVVGDLGVPLVINNIAPMAVSELSPDSDVLIINERIPSDHKMLFATSIVDDKDAHHHAFKMFYSGQNSPSDRELWGADELTKEALKELDDNRNTYNAKYKEWRNHYDSKPWYKAKWQCFKTFGLGACVTYNDCKSISNGYLSGLYQFRKVNDYWEYAVGARSYEVQFGTCEYEDQWGNVWGTPDYNVLEEDCQNGYWYPNGSIVSTLVDYDGLVTTESQSAWESCPSDRRYSLTPENNFKGSDHLQIKNDSNTEFILNFTLTGQGATFFKN